MIRPKGAMSKHFLMVCKVWYNILVPYIGMRNVGFHLGPNHKCRSLSIENQKSVNPNLHEKT